MRVERDQLYKVLKIALTPSADNDKPAPDRFTKQAAIDFAKLGFVRWIAENWTRRLSWPPAQSVAPPTGSIPRQPAKEKDSESVLERLAKRKNQDGIDLLDETLVKAIDSIGTLVARSTLEEIDKLFSSKEDRRVIRKQLANHFWCDLFASLAEAIRKFENALNKLPDWVTKAIFASVHQKDRPDIDPLLIKKAVEHAWKVIEKAIDHSVGIKKARVIFQVLAILCCPDPERHPAVFHYCIVPLGNSVLEPLIKQRLKDVLSAELVEGLNLDEPAPPDI